MSKLETTINQIEKQFGKGSIMKLGDIDIPKIPVISTGSIKLDKALGINGIPRGRIIEIIGPESSGKTTLTLHMIAEAQKDGKCVFIDTEHAFDPNYAKQLGVNIDDLYFVQPTTAEEALDIIEMLVRSAECHLIVLDSVAALVPKVEVEGEMGQAHMGVMARLMSQAMRKLAGLISATQTSIVFINQIRHKIGVMFGSPETTTGGNALKFYASMRLDIRKIEVLKVNQESIGIRVRVKVIKNKLAPPFKQAEFNIIYGKGIDQVFEIIEMAVENNIIKKSGAWYSYNNEQIGQGKEKVYNYLLENDAVRNKILDEVNNC